MFGFPHYGHALSWPVLFGAIALFALAGQTARAQQPEANYDESKVGSDPLPDPLKTVSGRKVESSSQWIQERRPELLRLFQTDVYGKVPQPPRPIRPTFHVYSEDKQALGGTAVRREVTILFTDKPDGPR